MVRNVLGVIVGYIVLALFIMCFFTGLYMALGADKTFQPGTYEPTMMWNALAFVLGLAATILGGVVCALIARRKGAVIGLMVVILVLGFAEVVFQVAMPKDPPGPREGTVTNFDAAMKAIKPLWVTIANPLLGALGAWIGGKMVLKGKGPSAAA